MLKKDPRKLSLIRRFLQDNKSDLMIIAACSTQIFETRTEPNDTDLESSYSNFMKLMEEFEIQYIRGLQKKEIESLCRQSKDKHISFAMDRAVIEEISSRLSVFPQPLQYACKELYDAYNALEGDPIEIGDFVKNHLEAAFEATYNFMSDNYFHHIFGSLTIHEQELLVRIALQKGMYGNRIGDRPPDKMKRLKNLGVLRAHPLQILLPSFSEWIVDALKGKNLSMIFPLLFGKTDLLPSCPEWEEEINDPDYLRTYIPGFFLDAKEEDPRPGDPQINFTLCTFSRDYRASEVIIDYGCGKGRLMDGLISLHQPNMTHSKKKSYIGINHGHVDAAKRHCDELGLDKCFDVTFYDTKGFEDCCSTIRADFCFMINVLHEIPYNEIPGRILSVLTSLKSGGHLLIHDMCELVKPERDFVIWDREEDFKALFDEAHFDLVFLHLKTKRGRPLYNLIVTKKNEGVTMDDLRSRIESIYRDKKKRVIEDINILESRQDGSDEALQRYVYHLKLHYNIDKQMTLL